MNYINQVKELNKILEDADYVDIKRFNGEVSLREFLASALSYYPWWIVMLYCIRSIVVKILGLEKQEMPDELPNLKPEEISFTPGESATFFIVHMAKENRYWIAETPEDKHLKAYLGIVVEPLQGKLKRFYMITTIQYKHWTGPVYFNLIRPFHHLVVNRMAKAGLKVYDYGKRQNESYQSKKN